MSSIYVFGNTKRLANFVTQELLNSANRFTILSLLNIGREDVILSPLPWSPFLDWFQARPAQERPYIIRTADGLITKINSMKPKNHKTDSLHARRNGDVFLIQQNIVDLDHIRSEKYSAISVREISIETSKLDLGKIAEVVFVFGNDPLLGQIESEIFGELNRMINSVRKLGIQGISISCPDTKFRTRIDDHFSDCIIVDKISELKVDPKTSLLICSPSTVSIDYYIRGYNVVALDGFPDPIMDTYFTKASHLFANTKLQVFSIRSAGHCSFEPLSENNITSLKQRFPKTKIGQHVLLRNPRITYLKDIARLFGIA